APAQSQSSLGLLAALPRLMDLGEGDLAVRFHQEMRVTAGPLHVHLWVQQEILCVRVLAVWPTRVRCVHPYNHLHRPEARPPARYRDQGGQRGSLLVEALLQAAWSALVLPAGLHPPAGVAAPRSLLVRVRFPSSYQAAWSYTHTAVRRQ